MVRCGTPPPAGNVATPWYPIGPHLASARTAPENISAFLPSLSPIVELQKNMCGAERRRRESWGAEWEPPRRGGGLERGLCPSPENFFQFTRKMLQFGAFRWLLQAVLSFIVSRCIYAVVLMYTCRDVCGDQSRHILVFQQDFSPMRLYYLACDIAIVSRPSVCLSGTLRYREHVGWTSAKLITRVAPRSHNVGNLVQWNPLPPKKKFGWNRGGVALLSRKHAISLKRGKTGTWLLLMINRKSHTHTIDAKINDLGWPWRAIVLQNTCIFRSPSRNFEWR